MIVDGEYISSLINVVGVFLRPFEPFITSDANKVISMKQFLLINLLNQNLIVA